MPRCGYCGTWEASRGCPRCEPDLETQDPYEPVVECDDTEKCQGDCDVCEFATDIATPEEMVPGCGLGVDSRARELWPEKWDNEQIVKVLKEPHEFARQFIGYPLPRNEIRFSSSRFGVTVSAVERIVSLAKLGVDVSGVLFVCASETQAEQVIRELVRLLGPEFEGMPRVKP